MKLILIILISILLLGLTNSSYLKDISFLSKTPFLSSKNSPTENLFLKKLQNQISKIKSKYQNFGKETRKLPLIVTAVNTGSIGPQDLNTAGHKNGPAIDTIGFNDDSGKTVIESSNQSEFNDILGNLDLESGTNALNNWVDDSLGTNNIDKNKNSKPIIGDALTSTKDAIGGGDQNNHLENLDNNLKPGNQNAGIVNPEINNKIGSDFGGMDTNNVGSDGSQLKLVNEINSSSLQIQTSDVNTKDENSNSQISNISSNQIHSKEMSTLSLENSDNSNTQQNLIDNNIFQAHQDNELNNEGSIFSQKNDEIVNSQNKKDPIQFHDTDGIVMVKTLPIDLESSKNEDKTKVTVIGPLKNSNDNKIDFAKIGYFLDLNVNNKMPIERKLVRNVNLKPVESKSTKISGNVLNFRSSAPIRAKIPTSRMFDKIHPISSQGKMNTKIKIDNDVKLETSGRIKSGLTDEQINQEFDLFTQPTKNPVFGNYMY